MRVLIVGGGVAGLTLAAKLLQQGRTPVVVEHAAAYEDVGYGLGLYPLGSCVLHGLGCYDELLAAASSTSTYEIADGRGELLTSSDMDVFTAHLGPVLMLPRSSLIDILRRAAHGADFRMGMTVSSLTEGGGEVPDDVVRASFSDGTSEDFDLVVGADGMYSQVRTMVFGHEPLHDTGWLFWTWWAPLPDWPSDLVREHWGSSTFFGLYPCQDQVMCGSGMPADEARVRPQDADRAKSFLRQRHAELIERDPRIGGAIDAAEGFFPWPMADVRAPEWVKGRVVLCGDAAAGFLPTAGVGASNALRAAAALSDELSRVGPETVSLGLELFVKRTRKIVEGNQQDSRNVAKYMFVDNRAMAWGRDQLVKRYPAERIVSQIVDSMRQPF